MARGPLSHLSDLARFRAQRGARERHDHQAMAELARTDLGLPAGLEIEWLGTAGYRITYSGKSLLIDPYLSRVPFAAVFRRRPALPDTALLERVLGSGGTPGAAPHPGSGPAEVVGVLVGHTHFDHAIDVPEICRMFNAKAYGSNSLVNLMALWGRADRVVEVEPHRTYELGPFEVSFTPSCHSKLLLGLKVPMDGELTCEHLDGLAPSAYRCGQVWGIRIKVAGITLYHQGSANLLDDEITEAGVDVFLAGIAGRSFTEDYWPRILRKLEPRLVVASHFDNFFKPIDEPMGLTANVDLAGFADEISAVSADFDVATMAPAWPVT